MADNVILTPGSSAAQDCANTVQEIDETLFLKVDNYLGEFETEEQKAIARANLGVQESDFSYSKVESDTKLNQTVANAMQNHLNTPDPHGILGQVDSRISGMVKNDGSTPFIGPQKGVDPITEFHLTTKRFVTDLLESHIARQDPHNTMALVRQALQTYAQLTDVYLKGETYNKREVDSKFTNLVKNDGTVPFVKPQLGVDPTNPGHLSTKRYVDAVIWEHLTSVDPHGFLTLLNQRLANYYTRNETYSKAETYSRIQLETIIDSLVGNAAAQAISEHISQYDPHGTLKEINARGYMKPDGSTPFTAPQTGKDAVDPEHLATLRQVQAQVEAIVFPEAIWITSGPTQSENVGFVETGTVLPPEVTFQEIMDLIFYGKGIEVTSPPYCLYGERVDVNMTIHGSMATVQYATLSQNGVIIGTYSKEDFTNGQLTVQSEPITEETTFEFIVYYLNGTSLKDTSVTKVAFGIFVGLLPKWYSGSSITYDYLLQLVREDPTNNIMDDSGDSVSEIKHTYNFSSPSELKHMFVAIPKEYPDLVQLVTPSQNFGIEAFDYISDIPMQVPGVPNSIIYKIYIYREALVALNNLSVTFKFE